MKIKEIESRRDQLEEKIETLLREFILNTGVRIEEVEASVFSSETAYVFIGLKGVHTHENRNRHKYGHYHQLVRPLVVKPGGTISRFNII